MEHRRSSKRIDWQRPTFLFLSFSLFLRARSSGFNQRGAKQEIDFYR